MASATDFISHTTLPNSAPKNDIESTSSSSSTLSVGFNIISDLHLDQLSEVHFPRLLKPSPRAQYLLISGDLSNPYQESYAEFLRKASSHYAGCC